MDANDKKDLDRILKVLYEESPFAWYKIYTDLGLTKTRADQLFKIGFAFDYLQVEHKGMLEYPTDNHYVGITKEGIRFFALENFSGTQKTEKNVTEPERFNVYINGSSGGFNLLDIDSAQLQVVVNTYLAGNPYFTIAGQHYHPIKFHTFKIFENGTRRNTKELKKQAQEEGSQNGFRNRYFSVEDLEELGADLTYQILGNSQFGSEKSSAVQTHSNGISSPEKLRPLKKTSERTAEKPIFISYSWDNQVHEDHVFSFADELRKNGFNVDIDKIIRQRKTSTNFVQMMHEAFVQCDQIIVVLSGGYKIKADSFSSGVGTEYRLILGEIDKFPLKYILVSFQGRDDSIIPAGLAGIDIIDLSLSFDPLFRKLTGQHEYELSPVSKNKPALAKREIAPFANHQNKIKSKTIPNASSQELLVKRIEKKKALKKDFAPWLDYKKEDVKKRFRMIIHSVENDTYPDQPMLPNVPATWFGAEIYGSSHIGIEFCNENTQLYVDENGHWSLKNSNQLTPRAVSVIKTISYDDIVAWDIDGDGIYNCPHFYANFINGFPWKDIFYVDHKKQYIRFDATNKIGAE